MANETGTKERVEVLDCVTPEDAKELRLIGYGLCPRCCVRLAQDGRLSNEGSTVRRTFKCPDCGVEVLAVYELTLATVATNGHAPVEPMDRDPLDAGEGDGARPEARLPGA